MAYGSKRYGSKRYGSKRRYGSKKNMSTYKKVQNLDKKVKKIQREEELKFTNGPIHATVSDDVTDVITFNGIAQGTTAKTRIGNEIRLTSLTVRGIITNSSASALPSQVRCILFWDRQTNGAEPNIATDTNGLLYPVEGVHPLKYPINYDQSDRYRVLWDHIWIFNPQIQGTQAISFNTVAEDTEDPVGFTATNTGTLSPNTYIPVGHTFYKKFKLARKTKYMDSDNTISAIASNSLNMVFIAQDYGDPMPEDTEPHLVDFDWQLFYKDV